MNRPPGSRGLPYLGNLLERERDPLGTMVRGAARHGDVVRFRMGPRNELYLLNQPALVKHVLVDNAANYPKNEGPGSLTGLGLFGSEGELWKRQRAMVQPAFHRDRLADMVAPMVPAISARLDAWEARGGEPFDLADELSDLTLELMCRLTFSAPPPPAVRDGVKLHIEYLNHPRHALSDWMLMEVLPRFVARRLSSRAAKYRAMLAAVIPWAEALVRERRAMGDAAPRDVLTALAEARDAQGEPMAEAQVRDELLTLFVGGHEATAVALAWTWSLLSRHPEVEERMRDEVRRVLGGRVPAAADVAELRYIAMVFQESLRLYPPAWMFSRIAQAPDRVADYDVAPGTMMTVVPYLLHRRPDVWEKPESFDPEHFTPERAARRARFSYLPFGGGQRLCVGNNLALVQGPLILAMTAQRLRVKVRQDGPPPIHAALTLRPRDGLPVTVSPA
jgi:cytochrome P450